MDQKKCERKLLDLLEQAVEVYHQYNQNGCHLSLCFCDGVYSVEDALRDKSGEYYDDWNKRHSIYITKFADGRIKNTQEWAEYFKDYGGDSE